LCLEEEKEDTYNEEKEARMTNVEIEEQYIDCKDLDVEIDLKNTENTNLYATYNMGPKDDAKLHKSDSSVGFNESLLSVETSQSNQYKRRYLRYEKEFAVTYIYMTDISKILVSSSVLIILKENFEVIKLLKDEDRVSDLVSLANICQSNAKEALNKNIEVVYVETLTDQVTHISQHFNKNTDISSLVYLDEAYYLDNFNNIRKTFIRVDRGSIHVMKKISAGIIISAKLADLSYVYIYDVQPIVKNHMELCNLRLVFGCSERRVDLKLYYKKREELLSVIITLRRITKIYVNEIRFILNDIDHLEKHYIVMP
jgi:hypothetical protein